MVTSKGESRRQRLTASAALIGGVVAGTPLATRLKSAEPAAAWPCGGAVCHATVFTRLSPEGMTVPAWGPPPLVLGVSVNRSPPPGLRYAMRDPAFLAALSLPGGSVLAVRPRLELLLSPEEAAAYGAWLPYWHAWAAANDPDAMLRPSPPSPLDGEGLAGSIVWTLSAADGLRCWYSREKG